MSESTNQVPLDPFQRLDAKLMAETAAKNGIDVSELTGEQLADTWNWHRGRLFAEMMASTIKVAAETHPELIREALASVFNLSIWEQEAKNCSLSITKWMDRANTHREAVLMMSEEVQKLRTEIDELRRHLDARVLRFESKPDIRSIVPKKGSLVNNVEDTYRYTDKDGNLLFEVIRFRDDKGELQDQPRKPEQINERGEITKWSYECTIADICDAPVLYRLTDVLRAPADRRIVITDNEWDADTLAELGFIATTNAFGGGHWSNGHADRLKGRLVIVVYQEPARASWVAGTLIASGAAKIWLAKMDEPLTQWLFEKMGYKSKAKYERMADVLKKRKPEQIDSAKEGFVDLIGGVQPWGQ